MKLWAGRTTGDVDQTVDDFNASLPFDRRLWREDVEGSLAHVAMLGARGIIPAAEADALAAALGDIRSEIEAGALRVEGDAEDIHTFIEAELTARLGDAGKRLHTARSRNDQVALDMRLWTRTAAEGLLAQVKELLAAVLDKAEGHLDTVLPGYTHLQRAQPVTYAHYLCAYGCMLRRDAQRLADCLARLDECPLGAGALAGTTHPIDREMTAAALGFSGPCLNSIDAVSDRDYLLELLGTLSILMSHLSRFSEEIILWCSSEFGFLQLADTYSTGSSIMPQKKNPDVAELVRGKTGRVYGSLVTLLTVLKGLPLAYNKDMQEDKECVFDAVDTVSLCLTTFTGMFRTLTVKQGAMRRAALSGFINATDCADYLAKKGVPFRDAYRITGQLVRWCVEHDSDLERMTLEEYRAASPVFEADIYEAVSLERCVEGRRVPGGPARESVERQIQELRRYLA